MKFADAVVHLLQSYRIGVPHRASSISWETIAVEIDDVDVDCAERVTFLQDARAFIDQGIDAAVDDFVGRNLTLRDAGLGGPLLGPGGDFGIRDSLPAFVVLVPAGAGLLTKATHFAETVSGKGLADAGFFQVTMFLADAPAYVEAGKIESSERAHRHP